MPRGPTPKEPAKRTRRNKPTFEQVELDTGAGSARPRKVKAPVLPARAKLLPQARAWYDTWARSPQAQQFLATDWQRLQMLARLVDDLLRTDDPKLRKELLGELRLQEAKFGATPEDRLRLRWQLREAERETERAEKAKAKPSRAKADPRLTLIEGGRS